MKQIADQMKAWVIPAALILALEYMFACAIGLDVGFRYRMPFETYLTLALTFAGAGISVIIVVKLAIYACQRESSPARRLIAEMPYVVSFLVGVLLFALQMIVLGWTKIMLPIASHFWADPWLADFDVILFRVDPWIIAYELFGWAAPLIDRAYVMWLPLKFCTFLFLICMPESERKSRALVSYFIMLGAVAVGQYVLASAGPVFYQALGDGQRFAQMPLEPWVTTAKTYLWQAYLKGGGDVGAGISAMPSLHVAASLWMALVWRSYNKALGRLFFGYFAIVAVGSVLLGWHYAADSLAAVLIALFAWRVSRGVIGWPESLGKPVVPSIATGEVRTSITPVLSE